MLKIINSFHGKLIIALSFAAVLIAFPINEPLRIAIGMVILSGMGLAGIYFSYSIKLSLHLNKFNKSVFYRVLEALAIGATTALFVLISVKLISFILPEISLRFKHDVAVPLMQITRVVFYAPIFEEIVFRLFFMTLIIWAFRRLIKGNSFEMEDKFVKWGIAISSLLFALAHLPGWLQVTDKFQVFVVVILLNMVASYVFSWMFLSRGLYLAMVAHFAADVVGHILGARLLFN